MIYLSYFYGFVLQGYLGGKQKNSHPNNNNNNNSNNNSEY